MSITFLDSTDRGLSFSFDAGPFIIEDDATISNARGGLSAALEFKSIAGLSVTNFGAIDGTGIGLRSVTSESTLHNQNGSIHGSDVGIQMDGLANTIVNATFSNITGHTAIDHTGFKSWIVNSGTIEGDIDGIGILDQGEDNYVLNRGVIRGGTGIQVGSENIEIVNWQSIVGFTVGIAFSAEAIGGVIRNNGFLSAGDGFGSTAIAGNDTAQQVFNTGTISGEVRLEGGDDLFDGRMGDGTDVWGGTGNDTVLGGDGFDRFYGGAGNDSLSSGGEDDELYGGGGDDTLKAGAGADRLDGGAGDDSMLGGDGADLMFGKDGQDTLRGGAGDDTLRGGDGDDALTGGSGNDVVSGGLGNDLLDGGVGDDVVSGGDGDDVITGGAGRDLLRGGEGNDVFVFQDETDSPADQPQKDIILDFTRGADRIDIGNLSEAGPFQQVDSFTGAALAEFQVVSINATSVRVLIDGDGDGTADTIFVVRGAGDLGTDDFIL